MIKDELPLLYSISYNKNHSTWCKESEWDDANYHAALIYHFESELENTNGDVELILARSTAFVTDMINLKVSHQEEITLLDFLQFHSSTQVLYYLTKNKYFSYCFDWINNSISETVSVEKSRDFYGLRIQDMIESQDQYIRSQFENCFPIWTYCLFYYSRCTGGHIELSKLFIQIYYRHFVSLAAMCQTIDYCNALTQISSWCGNYNLIEIIEDCYRMLLLIYQTTNDPKIKKSVAFQFSCLNNKITNKTKREWCKIVQDDYGHLLQAHEKFQILLNFYETDLAEILGNFDKIIKTIYAYSIEEENHKYELYLYHESRIFSICERLIITLVMNGHVEHANRIIGTYFAISSEKLITSQNAYIIPNAEFEVLYCFYNNVLRVEADTKRNLPAIVTLKNSFLGTTHTFNDNLSYQYMAPEREGVPNQLHANEFYVACANHMSVKKLLENPNIAKSNGYFLLLGFQLPIQQLIAMEIGITIPIIHSFLEPLPARTPRKVFIWQGYTQMAEIERLGLEEVFNKFGIEMVSINCHSSTKENFLENYINPEYDGVWIIGHGEFQHHESHKSYLDLGNDITISFSELKDIPLEFRNRRILVIDACDGATTSLSNSPVSVGIGASMIRNSQSLIGHSWPVQNTPSLILGILYAIFLCEGNSYAEAHNLTIKLFYNGKDEVLEFIKKYISKNEVIERIENNDLNYQNFYYWGSLVYII